MANIAYMRVSTMEQNMDRQENAFSHLKIDKIFKEKISGKDNNRPELLAMLEYVRENDIIYVESISRLGRNLKNLLVIFDQINDKGIGLVSLKENFIDTTTISGKLIFSIFATLSEFERDSIKLRQSEGIKIAKQNGRYMGRKKIQFSVDKQFTDSYINWKSGHLQSKEFMKNLGLKSNTFYRRIKEFENKII